MSTYQKLNQIRSDLFPSTETDGNNLYIEECIDSTIKITTSNRRLPITVGELRLISEFGHNTEFHQVWEVVPHFKYLNGFIVEDSFHLDYIVGRTSSITTLISYLKSLFIDI